MVSALTATEKTFIRNLDPLSMGSNSPAQQSNLFVEYGSKFKNKEVGGFQALALGVNANLVKGVCIKPMLAAVTTDYRKTEIFGAISAEAEPRLVYTGPNPHSARSRELSQEGIYGQFKISGTTPLNNSADNQEKFAIHVDKYAGIKGVLDEDGKFSLGAGIRMNDNIPGGKEAQGNFTLKLPLGSQNCSHASRTFSKARRCQTTGSGDLYLRAGVAKNFVSDNLSANAAIGINF